MNLPLKVNEREKKFLVIGGIAVIAIILFYAYSWYADYKKRAEDFSAAKSITLEKQLRRISEKYTFESKLNELKQELEKQETAVLKGDKPPIAAAALSDILRDAATSSGVNITMERTITPYEVNYYVAVPVEIGFTTTTEKLRELLYKVRTAPFLLTVSEIKIRVVNYSNPVDVFASLIVTGFIKKPAEAEKESKETNKVGKNDT
jgi:Tfp pilus assembly protein PilO